MEKLALAFTGEKIGVDLGRYSIVNIASTVSKIHPQSAGLWVITDIGNVSRFNRDHLDLRMAAPLVWLAHKG